MAQSRFGSNPYLPALGTPWGVPIPPVARVQVGQVPAMAAPALPKPPQISSGAAGGLGGQMSQTLSGALQYGLANQLMDQMLPGTPPLLPGGVPGMPNQSAPPLAPTSTPTGGSATQPQSHAAFVQSMQPTAEAWSQKTGIPADVLLAINVNEGNWGQAGGNELFGIKGSGNAGSINSPTWESVNGQHVNTNANFGAYKSPDDSYAAFWNLVSTSPRYTKAMAALQQGSTDGFLQGLVDGGYATDPNWASHIQAVASTTVDPLLGQ